LQGKTWHTVRCTGSLVFLDPLWGINSKGDLSMPRLLAPIAPLLFCLWLNPPPLLGEEIPAPASVRILGKPASDFSEITQKGKTAGEAVWQMAEKVQIKILTDSPAIKLYLGRGQKKIDVMTKEINAKVAILKGKKFKGEALKKELARVEAEYKPLKEAAEHCHAEGTLETDAKGGLVLRAKVREPDLKNKDMDLPLGGVMVEGEAVAGDFSVGNDRKTTLAIRNGKGLILLDGKMIDKKKVKGRIRATGELRAAVKGNPVVKVTKVAEVGK
jgi:hypothetical protein